MATADDGMTPYQSGGAGGKFRKNPIRRSAQTTPYARPPTAIRNNNPSLLAKLVDPASRLIYAGADRLFGVFRKRLPAITAPRIPENIEEPRNGIQEAVSNSGSKISTGASESVLSEGENLASVSAATEISEIENVLKQKTFTRSEIERLTALLHSRTTESDAGEGDKAKLPITSHLLRLEASTSGLLDNHVEERENFCPAISTPVINSRAFDEDVASPAELAKAYMGTRPAKVSPSTLRFDSQAPKDSVLLNNTTILPRTPITSPLPRTTDIFKGFENVLTTPRLRGRAAIHSMARTSYYRAPSTSSQKGVASPLLISSQSGWEHEGSSKAVKRRSSALDDLGSGGAIRRIRQKANLLSQGSSLSKHRSELGSSQKLLLGNEAEPKASKAMENGETSKRNIGYASVPTESTQMASKIFEQLERMSPKEKPSVSRLAFGSLHKFDSPKFLPSSQDNQKIPDTRESTSKSNDKVEENGPRKFAVPRNVLSSINGNSTMAVRNNSSIGTNADSTFKLPAEPPQKKRAFQMSAHEDSLELDADKHSNGHLSTDAPAEVIQTPAPSEVNNISGLHEFKNVDAPKSDFGPPEGSAVNKLKMGYTSPTSLPSGGVTQPAELSQSILIKDVAAQQKEPTVFPTFGTSIKSADKASPFSFSANELSGVKPNISLNAKPYGSTSYSNSALKNESVQFSAYNNNDNGSTQKSVNMFGKSEASSSASPTTTSASGIFSFGGSPKTSNITNGIPGPSSSIFASSSSSTSSGTSTNKLFSGSAALLPTTTTTSSAASSASPTSAPTPMFNFGAAISSSAPNSVPEAPKTGATKDTEPKSNKISNSLFASTSFATTGTGSSLFGFSSPAATSTTSGSSQASFNNISGFQASTQASTAVTQAAPFNFGSSTISPISGTTAVQSSSSGSSLFGSSIPSFGLSSVASSSDIKSGNSTSNTTTNVFGSGFSPAPSFGLSSAVATSDTKSVSSTSGSTNSIFGSTSWLPPQTSAFGSPSPFSFGASSTTSAPSTTNSPIVFGSSNTGASTGSSVFSYTAVAATTNTPFSSPVFGASPSNNDQMSMEDSMAEDSTQTPSSFPAFAPASGGTPGFMFGSGTPTPSTPFQFGGPTNQPQPPSQNPFQASGSVEFNAGGSFSLGSGGGDKSARRILRVKSKNRRK